jgi:ectoine hydroxylase-related dioxygenase (phytanoyl-CoA dioxygenase family)
VRLLESVVFNKPPRVGGRLAWHADISYYPLGGGQQMSVMIPFDHMSAANGAVSFAVGSHRSPPVASVDLRTGTAFAEDALPPCPDDPATAGYEVRTPVLAPGDVVLFGVRVWHGSEANNSADMPRRLLSLRFVSLDTRYELRSGNRATFVQQIRSRPGEPLAGGAFPIIE